MKNKVKHYSLSAIFFIFTMSVYGMGISVLPQKTHYEQGDSIDISLSEPAKEEELLLSYNNGPWLSVQKSSQQQKLNFKFDRDGLYSLQLNTTSNELAHEEKWLGQFYVGPINVRYVNRISWRPYKVTFKKNEPIKFIVDPIKPLDTLEFQVSMMPLGAKEWRVTIPWHSWPLPDLRYDQEKPVSIMMSVREKNSFLLPQDIWLSQFFREYYSAEEDNLLSAIMAHHRSLDKNNKEIDASVAKELSVAIYFLYSQYNHLSLSDGLTWLQASGIKEDSNGSFSFVTQDNVKLIVSLPEHTISDGTVTLDLSISNYPDISFIFDKIKDFPLPIQMAYLTTYYVYNHYTFSNINNRFARSWLGIRDTSSQCELSAMELSSLLKMMKYRVKAISISFFKDHKVIATHAVTEINYNGQYYVLDATTGRVGYATKKSFLITKHLPKFIIFPQSWRADELLSVGFIEAAVEIPLVTADEI